MEVVVILKNTNYCEGGIESVVHGVYVDLKEFYDEVREKGYEYDDELKYWVTVDEFGIPVFFSEEVQTVKGASNE